MGAVELKDKYFVGTTEKNPLEYNIGEEIVFKIRVMELDKPFDVPYVSYTITADDGQNLEGFAEKKDGWFYIKTTLKKCGFVTVFADACDENKKVMEDVEQYKGGAGANIFEIECGSEIPEDYEEFWQGLRDEVEAFDNEVLYCEKKEDENYPDFEMYDMRISAPEDTFVSLAVAYPKGAKKDSLKFLMFFRGHGVYPNPPIPVDGCFTIRINAHPIPNYEPEEYYKSLGENELKDYGMSYQDRPENTYWKKLFIRNLTAVKYFKNHELINKKDYLFAGGSQGGMQAINMTAHSKIATGGIFEIVWMADIKGYKKFGRIKNQQPKGIGNTYFDSAIAAKYIKCPVFIESGLGDSICPPATQMAIHNAIKTPKYHEFYQNLWHYTVPNRDSNICYAIGDKKVIEEHPEFIEIHKVVE